MISAPSAQDAEGGRARIVRALALVMGLLHTLVGTIGFFITGVDDLAARDKTLLGFDINHLHNVVHLALGIAGIVLSRRLSSARTFGWLLGVIHGVSFLYGVFAVDDQRINALSHFWADNWLHLVSLIAGMVIALLPAASRTANHAG